MVGSSKVLAFLGFVLFSVGLVKAQPNPNDAVLVSFKVKDDETKERLTIKTYSVDESGKKKEIGLDSTGAHLAKLDIDHLYKIYLEAQGYVTKHFEVDTRMPLDKRESVRFEMEISLFKVDGKNYDVLKDPVAKCNFSASKGIMRFDENYYKKMMAKIRVAKGEAPVVEEPEKEEPEDKEEPEEKEVEEKEED